jgi:hypothetical protein
MTVPSVGEIVAITTTASEPLVMVCHRNNAQATGVLLADLATETLHRLRASERDTANRRQLGQAIGRTDNLMSFTVPLIDFALVERDSNSPGPFAEGDDWWRAYPSPGTATDTARPDTTQWRLRYLVGEPEHYTEWPSKFPTIENYYDQ